MIRVQVIQNRKNPNNSDYDGYSITQNHGELFKDYCREKRIPISLPYIGGQYWAKALAKLGYIAIMHDSFGVCAYIPNKESLDRYQRDWLISQKKEWKNKDFSAEILTDDGYFESYDPILLKTTTEEVIDKVLEDITPVVERPKVRRKRKLY